MKNLFKSLSEFQNEVPIIHKGEKGYGYSYAGLSKIIPIINPILKKHGLGFYQAVNIDGLKTVVYHIESGEFIESITKLQDGVTLKGMNEFQVLGSSITYIRRYALATILGLVTDTDIDAGTPSKENVDLSQWVDLVNGCSTNEELELIYKSNKEAIGNDTSILKLFSNRKKELNG